MRHNIDQSSSGFALVAVLFIMVIMSAAVLMMSRLADMQAAERTMDLMGARALSAAKSGLPIKPCNLEYAIRL